MKKVLSILLLALLMGHCHNHQVKTDRERYPEKFTENYISERSLSLIDGFLESDGEAPLYKDFCTESYYDFLTEALALPKEDVTERVAAWIWMGIMEGFSADLKVTEVEMMDDNHVFVKLAGIYGESQLVLAFVGEDWLIDDVGGASKEELAEIIQADREEFKTINWQEEFDGLMEMECFTEEECAEIVDRFRKDVESYLEKYPLE